MYLKNLVLISATVLVVALIFEIFLFLSGSKILTKELEVLPGEYLETGNFARIFGNEIDINEPCYFASILTEESLFTENSTILH